MPRGRATVAINIDKLVEVLKKLETERSFECRMDLFKEASKEFPEVVSDNIPMLIYLRVRQHKIELNTPNKRGRRAGSTTTSRVKNTDVIVNTTPFIESLGEAECTTSLVALSRRANEGDLLAVIKMKCLDCSGFDKNIVESCPVTTCPLHSCLPRNVTMS